MLIRIVKLTFAAEHVPHFLQLFNERKDFIANSEGCLGVELLRDVKNPHVFFTYSRWHSELHLNAYRESPLFKEVWGNAKKMFAEKPEAWSVMVVA